MQADRRGRTTASAHPPPSEAGDRGGRIVMVREVVVEVRLFNSYVGLRGRGRLRAVGGGRGWTDLPGILLSLILLSEMICRIIYLGVLWV